MSNAVLDAPHETPAGAPAGYGGLRIDGMALALPMAALREVVPCGALLPLPTAADGVAGAIELRGVLVPVLDLRRLLGRAPAAPACVVVLVHGGRLLGLGADGVTGILAAEGIALHALGAETADAGTAAGLLTAAFRRPDDGSLVSLLSAAALFALPGVPSVADPEPERAAAAERDGGADNAGLASGPAATEALMVVRCGATALAIEAEVVHATLDAPLPGASPLAQGACRGVIPHLGQSLPAVDLLALAGLGRLEADDSGQAFLVDLPPGRVACLVSEVLDVVRVPACGVVAVPAFALARADLVPRSLPLAALPADLAARCERLGVPRQLLVVSGAGLRADTGLRALASTTTPAATRAPAVAGAPDATGDAVADSPRSMLLYRVHGEIATPIDQISEILPYRAEPSALPAAPHLLGLQIHRGRAIALLCVARLLGLAQPCNGATASVLVVEQDGEALGFVVSALGGIEAARWTPTLPRQGAQAAAQPLVQIGDGADRRLVPLLDLQALAADLRRSALSCPA